MDASMRVHGDLCRGSACDQPVKHFGLASSQTDRARCFGRGCAVDLERARQRLDHVGRKDFEDIVLANARQRLQVSEQEITARLAAWITPIERGHRYEFES